MPRKTLIYDDLAGFIINGFNEAAARCRGKLLEDITMGRALSRFNEAAARCRGKRALRLREVRIPGASMRPRPDAAENGGAVEHRGQRTASFNEAAARCRGKPSRETSTSDAALRAGFNEAAARCRGKRTPCGTLRTRCWKGFNEAAARCRGKLGPAFEESVRYAASMRPRPDAAENFSHSTTPALHSPASMRPRPDAAENRRTIAPVAPAPSLQ